VEKTVAEKARHHSDHLLGSDAASDIGTEVSHQEPTAADAGSVDWSSQEVRSVASSAEALACGLALDDCRATDNIRAAPGDPSSSIAGRAY
jgi:hypothetical protein